MRAFYNEIDPYAAAWLRNLIDAGHIAPGVVDERSVVDIDPAELAGYEQCHFFAGIGGWSYALRLAGWSDVRSVWTGSCPCQPFSAAGKRAGHEDERHLWPAWFRLIRECRPSVVFGEQVAGADGLAWLDVVLAELEALDYAVAAADLPAAGVGAPHIRQRLYFVADAMRAAGERGAGGVPRAQAASGGARRLDGCRADGSGDGGASRGMGDADDGHQGAERRVPGESGAEPAGVWDDAEWIPCRDGKWRPTQPGLLPLAHGATYKLGSGSALEGKSRVGMLRAYGNAIVAPLAAEFVAAYMDLA